jgi:hypothetical protein
MTDDRKPQHCTVLTQNGVKIEEALVKDGMSLWSRNTPGRETWYGDVNLCELVQMTVQWKPSAHTAGNQPSGLIKRTDLNPKLFTALILGRRNSEPCSLSGSGAVSHYRALTEACICARLWANRAKLLRSTSGCIRPSPPPALLNWRPAVQVRSKRYSQWANFAPTSWSLYYITLYVSTCR